MQSTIQATTRTNTALWQCAIQYLLAAAIFIIYGIQVCPFLDSLNTGFLVTVVSLLFIVMFALRSPLVYSLHQRQTTFAVQKQFFIDIGLFTMGGLSLAIGNQIVFDFPIEASIRIMMGFVLLGYFVSLQLMLQAEHEQLRWADWKEHGNNRLLSSFFFAITSKIRWLVFSLLLGSIFTLLMIVWKDFEWLQEVGNEVPLETASLWIFYEFLFVAAVFTGYGFMIIQGMARNLQQNFQHQQHALSLVQQGDRQVAVPVISNDEFRHLAEYTNQMIHKLRESEEYLIQTRDSTILAISSLAETRDNETGAHILRTQYYVKALAEYLKKHNKKFADSISEECIELMYKSAPLHDIGKVGIPDAILLKPGKLTDEEFEVMKQHPLIGKSAIEKAEEQNGQMPFLHYAKEISISHHEKWDGSGYPYGLKGDEIPLSGRLMALADVYDALVFARVYKPAFSHEKSRGIIIEGKGKHFDPDVVDAFLAIEDEFIAIAARYKD